jgi:hypothetical protein
MFNDLIEKINFSKTYLKKEKSHYLIEAIGKYHNLIEKANLSKVFIETPKKCLMI